MTVARHIPASHPVRRRMAFRAALEVAMDAHDSRPTISAMEVASITTRIEDLAQRVVLMPDVPLTGQQRRSLLVIARELERRASTLHERS